MIGRLIRTFVGLIGITLIGGSVILLFAPEMIEPTLPVDAITQSRLLSRPRVRAGIFATLGLVAVLWTAGTTPSWNTARSRVVSSRNSHPPEFETLRADPPETATATSVIGRSFEGQIEAARAAAAVERDDTVRERLQSLAVETLVTTEGYSQEVARERVAEGLWTDDALAAAYLANSEATLPFWRRLLAWLRPAEARNRRIGRAVDAIATRASESPDREPEQGDHI